MEEQASAGRATRAGAAKLLVVALLAAALVALATDRAQAEEVGFVGPDSDVGFADTDGYVPVYRGCLPNNVGAFYAPYYDGRTIQGSIVVNACYLERVGAGPTDLRRLLAHERGHARGLLHSPDPSSIMYPEVPLTGS